MTSSPDKRLIACARTLLYNYGQGNHSPVDVFFDCCHILQAEPKLSALPEFKELNFPFSFFSKRQPKNRDVSFCLYEETETSNFLSLPTALKLNWLYNFTSMQVLLFNFSYPELDIIYSVLGDWQRPAYDYLKIPFCQRIQPATSSYDTARTSVHG